MNSNNHGIVAAVALMIVGALIVGIRHTAAINKFNGLVRTCTDPPHDPKAGPSRSI